MNIISLITFLAGLLYLYLGYFGLKIEARARTNQIFSLLCLACSWWAFCIAFMFPAADRSTAWLLMRLSSPGWCLGPALILHFTIQLTMPKHSLRKSLFTLGIYIPALVFTVIGLTSGVTTKSLVLKSFGWDNIPANSSVEYWAYVTFYLLCVSISIIMVLYWGYHSNSKREKEQAKILAIFSALGLLLAAGSETLLPLIGITSYPKIPVVMWLLWAYGMWYAISKYRFLILTPEIATQAIVSSITDMMIMINSKGQILIANNSIRSLLGYHFSELINQPASKIFASEYFLKNTLAQMNAGILTSDKVELDYRSKNGENIPVMLSCSALIDSFDELAGVVLVAHDLRPTRLLEIQNAELEAITNDLLETNVILENKTLQIKNILDNVGQGFITFGPDLLINEEYSQECNRILAQSPARQTLAQVLYPGDIEQADFLKTIFTRLFELTDPDKITLYTSLLPSDVYINNRWISLEYQIVKHSIANDSKYIICILTDVTEKRLLEEKMEEERASLRMVVNAIVYYDTFMESIEDFKYFINHQVNQILASTVSLDAKLAEIFRSIHTFKGNFSQFDTSHIVKKLHNAETYIGKARESKYFTDENSVRSMLVEFNMEQWLDDDIRKITNYLGEDFFNSKDTFKVDKSKLEELENKMLKLLPHREYELLLPHIRRLRYKPFKEMLKSYPEYVIQLAERMGKTINPIIIEGDDLLVDHEYYHLWARSLVHVFRNIVDHGIEYVDERIILGKSETGNIRCWLECQDEWIKLSISDDGAGIDVDKLKAKAISSGKYSKAELAAFSSEQLINLIFADEVSTADSINLISGRGVGLSILKRETERINGRIKVNTELGVGTEFIFDLPVPNSNQTPLFSISNIITAIMQTVQDYALQYLNITPSQYIDVITTDRVCLNKYTAMLNIRGVMDGIVIMSYSDKLMQEFARILIADDFSNEQDLEVFEDLTAEATNIILGNSLKNFGDIEDLVRIGVPTVTANRGTSIKISHTQIYSCSIDNSGYMVTCSFIPI